jgi:hypothetical protein
MLWWLALAVASVAVGSKAQDSIFTVSIQGSPLGVYRWVVLSFRVRITLFVTSNIYHKKNASASFGPQAKACQSTMTRE